MGVNVRLFSKIEDGENVEVAEVDGIMTLLPMTSGIEAEYGKRGTTLTGGKKTGSDFVATLDADPVRQLEANQWLFAEIVKGWEIEGVNDDGEKVGMVEFNPENLAIMAGEGKIVEGVIREAKKLAGRWREEDEKN